jgi:hypothetical protein
MNESSHNLIKLYIALLKNNGKVTDIHEFHYSYNTKFSIGYLESGMGYSLYEKIYLWENEN